MEPSTTNPLYTDDQQQVKNNLHFDDSTIDIASPLSIDIPDDDLEEIIRERVKASSKFFNEKYNLKQRRHKNEEYLFGRQIARLEQEGKLKDYETRSNINALYEIEASLKPLAMSKIPDIIVTPGTEDPDKQKTAKMLSKAVDTTNKAREQREVLGLAFKHLPVYLTGVIKTYWDADKGLDGDYTFCNVNPEYIVVDHTATSKNVDDMGFIAQIVPQTIQDLLMKFPSKKDEIYAYAQMKGIMVGLDPTWKDLASEVKMWEVWFDWYKRKDSTEILNKEQMLSILEPGVKWEKISGVMWRLGEDGSGFILDKMLDPNFDHEGEQKFFTYQNPGDQTTKTEVQPQDMLMAQITGQPIPNLSQEKVFHNYFDRPHKPFYFMGYDQWGKVYLDETSRIEQNLRNQENLDSMNKQVLDTLKTRIKHIWSKDSGIKKGEVQRLDMDDPKLDVMVEGNPQNVHAEVRPERPDAAQFNAIGSVKQDMYALAGASAVRGQIQSNVATTNQIAREADFTRADDLVEDTINAAAEWMAQWQMQFIKLRYTEDHMKQLMGSKGEITYIKLRRDMISDGMEVMVKASSTDKLKAQRNAMDTAQLGPPFTNPIDFFSDMGMNDPEGRTERGLMFMSDPSSYYAKYVLGLEGPQQMAGAIQAGVPQGPGAPQPGQAPQGAPQAPTATNTSAVPSQPPVGVPASPNNGQL